MRVPVFATIRPPIRLEVVGNRVKTNREKSSVTNLLLREALASDLEPSWYSSVTPTQAVALGRLPLQVAEHHLCLEPVAIEENIAAAAYNDFATRVLWFAHHDLLRDYPLPSTVMDAYSAFRQVNNAFACALANHPVPSAPVIVNDYQLMLVPSMLRRLRPDVRIVHVSYTAIAPLLTLRQLPFQLLQDLIEGLLGADTLVFMADIWASRFVRAACLFTSATYDRAARVLRHGQRATRVCVQPVFPDPAIVPSPHATSSDDHPKEPRVVVRTDRLDPAKNILLGLHAFADLLRAKDPASSNLCMRARLVPTRQDLPEYREYAEKVYELASSISNEFPGALTLLLGDDHRNALNLLADADLILANSVADGMNLAVQEGVIVNQRAAAVVLAQNTGAARLFGGNAVSIAHSVSLSETTGRMREGITLSLSKRKAMLYRARLALSSRRTSLVDRCLTETLGP